MAETKDEEATRDESSTGSDPAGDQQGNSTGLEPDDRELQDVDDSHGGHRDRGLADDGAVVAHVDGAGDGVQGSLFSASGLRISAWSGPLPSPEVFAAFEQALPGTADRIITMAENAQAAEIKDRHTSTEAEARSFTLAAFGVSFFPWLLALATVALAIAGENTAAVWTAVGTISTAGPQIIAQVRPRKNPEGDSKKDK